MFKFKIHKKDDKKMRSVQCSISVRVIISSGRVIVDDYSGTKCVFIGVHDGIEQSESKCNGNCAWLLLIKFSMEQVYST